MSDRDNLVLMYDTIFAQKGVAGTWQGAPSLIIDENPDAEIGFGNSKLIAESIVLKVRASEVVTAAKGDVVTLGMDAFEVTDTPRFDDRYRLVWCAQAKRLT